MRAQDKTTRPRKQRKRPLDPNYKRHREEDRRGLPREDYSLILGYERQEEEEEEEKEKGARG